MSHHAQLLSGDIKLVSLGFRGAVVVRQRVEQARSAHRKFFLTAADWLSSNQDEKVGDVLLSDV